jgi:hypothetical protein
MVIFIYMSGKRKLIRNAPLEAGDSVLCVRMSDEYSPIPTGMKGKVKSVATVYGDKQYYVDWKNGERMALIEQWHCPSCNRTYKTTDKYCDWEECPEFIDNETHEKLRWVDEWMKVIEPTEEPNDVSESFKDFKTKKQMINETKNMPKEFVRLSKMYEIWKIYDFLNKLRDSGVVNMVASYPYLYLGKERIEHEHKYTYKNEDEFNEVLNMAEDIRNVMIRGAFKHLDSKRKGKTEDEDEDDDRYLQSVEGQMRIDAKDILYLWTKLKGGTKQMK